MTTSLLIRTVGAVTDEEVRYARARLEPLVDKLPVSPLSAEVALGMSGDPGHERPAMAQVTLRTAGTGLRAHVSAHTAREAVDLVSERLQDKAEHRSSRLRARRREGLSASDGEWRHGNLIQPRPRHFLRPPEERQVVRHQPITGPAMSLDEAAFDMEQLDYEFLLFRDIDADSDCLLKREADGTYVVSRLDDREAGAHITHAVEVKDATAAVPTLTTDQATELLDRSGSDAVLFRTTGGRGAVVYVRYDGHYGLVTLDGGVPPAADGTLEER